MYYSCHCIKRNGLQHDCRRTGCGGEPACLVLPDPLCAPSQLARARGLADPAPLAAHLRAQGGGAGGSTESNSGGGGKRFIVCELKGIVPDATADKGGKCCKCPTKSNLVQSFPIQNMMPGKASGACICPKPINNNLTRSDNINQISNCKPSMVVFDEETIQMILKKFEDKEIASEEVVRGPGGRVRKIKKEVKEEPCTRPGCVHWKPPPPCVWDAPCKADCFETPVGIQPGRNKMTGGSGFNGSSGSSINPKYKLLMPSK